MPFNPRHNAENILRVFLLIFYSSSNYCSKILLLQLIARQRKFHHLSSVGFDQRLILLYVEKKFMAEERWLLNLN